MAKFQKGQSGNPSGQPRGLQRLVREMLGRRGWSDVVRVQYEIATVSSPSFGDIQPKDATAAAKWLADRGFGQPSAAVDVTSNGETVNGPVTVNLDAASMTEEQLAEIEECLANSSGDDLDSRPPSDEDLGGDGTIGGVVDRSGSN